MSRVTEVMSKTYLDDFPGDDVVEDVQELIESSEEQDVMRV